MKKNLFIAIAISAVACNSPASNKAAESPKVLEPKYAINFTRDSVNYQKHTIDLYTQTDTITAANDTIAYLTAYKKFYNNKIEERENLSLAQWKSFTLTDKNGVDVTAKLPATIVVGIQNQVKNLPEVKKYIDAVNQDSLSIN